MADITRIVVDITTAAGTDAAASDGTAYLGIAGREFVLDNPGENLQQGQSQRFVFGDGATVNLPELNDPRKPQLSTDGIDRYPAYIRYTSDDGWGLSAAAVSVDAGGDSYTFYSAALSPDGRRGPIWLRSDAGQTLYLRRVETVPAPGPAPAPGLSQGSQSPGPRIVYGNVDKDGHKQSGSDDFWVSREGQGRYSIGFNFSYTSTPTATATITGDGWVVLDNAQIAIIDTHHMLVATGDNHGNYGDRPFSFHVIGQA